MINEQFSAFLDCESTRDETDSVVNNLLRDEAMRQSWCRQHWVREVLRTSSGEPTVSLDMGFSERVMQAVRDDEHTNAAVTAAGADSATGDALGASTADTRADTVVPMHRPKQRRRWRTMASFAVAASAAGIALFVVDPMVTTPDDAVTTSAPATHTTASTDTTADVTRVASAGSAASANLEMSHALSSDMVQTVGSYQTASRGAMDHWEVSNSVLANRLNGYLVEHNGLARGYGLGATTPGFIRVATYGQGGFR